VNPDATTIPALSSMLTKNGAPPPPADAGTTPADTGTTPTDTATAPPVDATAD
jgi:hypothetical protein